MAITYATRAALNFGRYQRRTEYLAMRGDHAANLLRVRQPGDPFPIYERIREQGEVYRSRLGVLCTVSQPLCRSVTTDARFGALPPAPGRPDWTVGRDDQTRLVHPIERSLLSLDPPDHTRLRHLVSPWFTPRALNARAPRIRAIIGRLLDGVADRGEFDLVSQVSKYVPFEILRDMMDLSTDDRDRLIWWAGVLVNAVDGPHTMTERRAVHTALVEMTAFFATLVAQRRRAPGDDLVSAVVRDADDEEAVALLGLVFIAGQPTAACLLNNCVRLLLEHPEQKELLLADPDIAPNVVEESLRYDPSGRLIVRLAAEDATVRGHDIPAGSILIHFIAGANRDPGVFTDPHRYDVTRQNSREHVTFSGGAHHCIGAGLARLQAEIMVGEVFTRFPDLQLAGRPRMSATRGHRSPTTLPLRVGRTRSVPGPSRNG
ncbi:cytochrome P450 [Micromonospora sp. NPDC004704]